MVRHLKLKSSGYPYYIPSVYCTTLSHRAKPAACPPHEELERLIMIVVKYVETIYLETYELYQNWNNHAFAFVCWDVIMNQWSKVFHS